MTSREYFESRALYREQRQKNKSENFLKNLEKTYKNAQKEIEQDLDNFYKRYFDETNNAFDNISGVLSPNESKDFYKRFNEITIERGLTKNEIDQLQKTYLEERITRLQALKKQIELQMELLSKSTDISTFEHLKEVYEDSYFDTAHQLYENNANVGELKPLPEFMALSFHTLNVNAIESVVSNPWSGYSFSERIWRNKNKAKREIIKALSVGIAQGHNIDKMSRKLSNRMDVAFSDAKRLVRTETNYVMGEATHDTYINAGIEMYEFLATLDYKTSEICRELDGKRFYLKDRKVGVNCNPMHPNCRSTTIPYFPEYEDEKPFYRIARGTDGKTYTIPDNINYKKWFKGLSEEEKLKATVISKQKKNKTSDKEQYAKYKSIYGEKEFPSLEKFKEIKYGDSETWVKYKEDKQLVLNQLEYNPEFFGKFGNKEVRLWYKEQDSKIPDLIDKTKTLEEQAKQACELRNKYKQQARDMMKNQELRKYLDQQEKPKSFDELVLHKKEKYGLTNEEAYTDVIRSSTTTNKKYDKLAGLEE